MRVLRGKDYAALVDGLRRCSELLDQAERPGVTLHTDYWKAEREHAVAVARRLLRTHDPKGKTDRTVA